MTDSQQRIADLVRSDQVVLFMKGTRAAPQCGFSANIVQLLDQYLLEYTTVDVLVDPAVREGVKQYANWPTIPQLYVRGEFVGGCDIVRTMDEQGDLATALGDLVIPVEVPAITITDAAAEAFRGACQGVDPNTHLRIIIDRQFGHDLSLSPRYPSDVVVESNGIALVLDRASARRAANLHIDYLDAPEAGFKIHNPNDPAQVSSDQAPSV